MPLFDTHAHYQDNAFRQDRRELLEALPAAGVEAVVVPGVDVESSRAALALAEGYGGVYAAVGIHPEDCAGWQDADVDELRSLAAHRATMVLFLSTSLADKLQDELLAGGYLPETPAAVVYKATWPEEKIFRCTVGTLAETVEGAGLTKTALIIVGNCLGEDYERSKLYDPGFTTGFRRGAE